MEEISNYFNEHAETFTIYVVEQKFATGQGLEYFKQFQNTEHFIKTDSQLKKMIMRVLAYIQVHVPDAGALIKLIFSSRLSETQSGIVEAISILSKLFSLNQHQAAGPKVIDPIIIEENKISSRYLAQLVALHMDSILCPAIIIILRDNNFARAKDLLSQCPNGINAKLIKNGGKSTIYKVINTGAKDIDGFIDLYGKQCFSTCSCTPRDIITGGNWKENDYIHSYAPDMFRIHSSLLVDDKGMDVKKDIEALLCSIRPNSDDDRIAKAFILMAKLYKVYCNDYGGQDIQDALQISEDLNMDFLRAHVYRYASLIPHSTRDEQNTMLLKAESIFSQNDILDHALNCRNNRLLSQFYTHKVNTNEFFEMQSQALADVPGMVGMSMILNNTGVAYLYKRELDEAIKYFNKGIDYSRNRIVQKIGLKNNILIAKSCQYVEVKESDIYLQMDLITYNLSEEFLPFIAANYIVNLLVISERSNLKISNYLMEKYPIQKIINAAFTSLLGSGSLTAQIAFINSHYPHINIKIPKSTAGISSLSGVRKDFVIQEGLNPVIFNIWV